MADVDHSGTAIVGGHANAVASGAAGFISGANQAKLDGISALADVTSAALVAAGTTTAHVAAVAEKLELVPTSMNTITTGTTQPISFTDALFTGLVTGGAAVGSGGTLGVIATAFDSSGSETGTGANQGGLGSAASSTQPYNTTDFVGQRVHCDLRKSNSEPLVLSDVLSTAAASFPLSVAAPVFLYLARRTDLGADAKWRGWFYFRNQATGNLTPVTPDISVATVSLNVPQVVSAKDVPTNSLYVPVQSLGASEVVFGGTTAIADLGTKAGGASGLVADAAHVHQISTTTPAALGTAAIGTGTTPARADHVHAFPGALGAIDNAVPRADGTGGLTFQNSTLVITDAGVASGITFADPSAAQDPATKNYVDTRLSFGVGWSASAAPGVTANRFMPAIQYTQAVITTENQTSFISPIALTLKNLYAKYTSTGLATDSITGFIRINGVNTAITWTITGGTTTTNDTTHTAAVAAGDILTHLINQSSTEAQANLQLRVAVGRSA